MAGTGLATGLGSGLGATEGVGGPGTGVGVVGGVDELAGVGVDVGNPTFDVVTGCSMMVGVGDPPPATGSPTGTEFTGLVSGPGLTAKMTAPAMRPKVRVKIVKRPRRIRSDFREFCSTLMT